MTIIYIAQHGIATTSAENGNRPLTDEGQQQVVAMANLFKKHSISLNKVFHSGKLRAQQSAEVFSQILPNTSIEKLNGMAANDPVQAFINQSLQHKALYVGHLPHINRLVSLLINGDENKDVIEFKNASVACIQIEAEKAILKWFLTPDLC